MALAQKGNPMSGRTTWYSVHIERGGSWLEEESADRLIDALKSQRHIEGPVVSWGGIAGGPAVTLSIQARDPIQAVDLAVETFDKALYETGLQAGPAVRIEVMTEEYQERWLAEEPDGFVGVSEIARVLEVSKQRVFELRARRDFPKPVAELAAGPVWKRSSLNHFLASWPRKPGRPRKAAN